MTTSLKQSSGSLKRHHFPLCGPKLPLQLKLFTCPASHSALGLRAAFSSHHHVVSNLCL